MNRPIDNEWPAQGLETLGHCPVCLSPDRSLIHAELKDVIFFAAPGEWYLWRCLGCRSAFLDPRPTEDSIGLAYSTYYTHAEPIGTLPGPKSAFERLRASLGNGYRNYRFGTKLWPAMKLGAFVGHVIPPFRWATDIGYRVLPPPSGKAGRLLDIGSGNGAFLTLARDAGWRVFGVEPDLQARKIAETQGIEVRGAIEDWLSEAGTFDYVTFSHVIEHLHDPVCAIRHAWTLLRSEGGIYVDTPNIDAVGHSLYGKDWRGLEPPRHLVLFNRKSLRDSVASVGFDRIRFHPCTDALKFTATQSRRMAAGLDPYGATGQGTGPIPGIRHKIAGLMGRRSEFLTLTATKP